MHNHCPGMQECLVLWGGTDSTMNHFGQHDAFFDMHIDMLYFISFIRFKFNNLLLCYSIRACKNANNFLQMSTGTCAVQTLVKQILISMSENYMRKWKAKKRSVFKRTVMWKGSRKKLYFSVIYPANVTFRKQRIMCTGSHIPLVAYAMVQ